MVWERWKRAAIALCSINGLCEMRLNGWQKIGVVLSVVWAAGTCALCAVAVRQEINNAEQTEWQYAQSTCEIDTREAATTRKEFVRSCAVEAKNAGEEGRQTYWSNVGAGFYVFIGLVALLPVFAGWAIVYAITGILRWMRLKPLHM